MSETLLETTNLIAELKALRETIISLDKKKMLFINSLHDSQLKLLAPLPVSLEYDGYQFIAYAPDLDIYGCGDSEYEALADLRQSIIELYFDLKDESLGYELKKIWEYLSSITEENED